MDFRDLGPLQVAVDGITLPMNGQRLESVLALLVANVGEVVTVDALVDAVWGASASARAAQSLESLVWRLRKVLEPDRVAGQTAAVLQTHERGYRLAAPPHSVDSRRLLQAARVVPDLLEAGDAERALDTADAALVLWRGLPYQGVPDADWMPPVRAQLAEVHLGLQQQRVEALLQTAQPERALHELGPLLSAHRHREQLWGQRMLALYRCGRQADALQTFADARAALADELGVDPGPELRALQQRILGHDPALDLRGADQPVRLPRRRTELVGRARELAELSTTLGEHALVTLTGPGGAGKTRLAVEAAHLAKQHHPDGLWFVELADVETDDPAVIWPRIALNLGLTPQPDTTTEHGVATFLMHRRTLLVLDNCEQIVDGIRAVTDRILDTCPAVTVLTTSREPLDLPDEHVVVVPPLPPDSAATLFLRRVGRHLDDHRAVARICAAVDGLPLGLELAAAHARTFALAEIADALEHDPIGLTRPGRGPTRQRTLYDTVDWSYRLSRPAEQALHRRLSTIGGPVTLDAAQALCAVPPLRPEQAMDLLAGLVHRSLLKHLDRPGGPSRFAQHVPIRAHARSSLPSDEAAAVEEARDRWVRDKLRDVRGDGREGQANWYDWLEANHAVLDAALHATLVHRPSAAGLHIAEALVVYWYDRNLMAEGLRWIVAAHRLPDLDPFERACADASYGTAMALNSDAAAARPHLERALAVLPSISEPRAGNLLVRIAVGAWVADLWADAEVAARAAWAIGERLGDPHLTLRARAVLSACTLIAGDSAQAVGDAADVLDENRAVGNHFAAFFACVTGGVAAVSGRDPVAGLHWTATAIRHQRALGMRNVGDTLEQRGRHFATAARTDVAVRCYAASAAQSEREGRPWPHHPGSAETLDRLRASLSAAEFERNWAGGARLGRATHDELPDEWVEGAGPP
ncbi:MAG: winged helix-turn-helix domain-containing protein [Pseudonocardia sp.]|nr:winged helix-turn-helix domain-containing protein [Pseudonocardia sp.]